MKPEGLTIASQTGTPDEHALLAGISKGDEVAFRHIYDCYRKKVYSYALKILKYDDKAEDIVHEVFLRIWKHEHPEKIDNLGAYLHIMTRNCVFKALKKQSLELIANNTYADSHNDICENTEHDILWKDAQKLLREGIESLPPQQKMVFRLCREEGMKYEEVAERMSISRLTVKTHMQHALRFLRTYISRHTDAALAIFLLIVMR